MAYNVKFLQGSAAAYGAIATKDLNTFYYVDGKDLYLGEIKLSNGADLAAAILRIADNETDIVNLQEDIKALTGGETGSISGMINDAVSAAKTELEGKITANTNAIATEKSRAEGIEAGLRTDVDGIKADYLKAADKTELEGKITAEATTARAAEKANADAIAAVKEDVDAFFLDADLTANAKDTLKEIQEYINSDAGAAAEMTASIQQNAKDIDAIEADYLKAADKEELAGQINAVDSYVNMTLPGILAEKAAQSDLDGVAGRVTTVEGKVSTLEGKVDVEKVSTAIATAKGEATKHADDAIAALDATVNSADVEEGKGIKITVVEADGKLTSATVSGNYDNKYDVKGAAATVLTEAKGYTDDEIEKLANVYEAKGAEDRAKAYADGLAKNYATAAQGAKADTALQAADITTGGANGTIAVKGTDVAVKGLGSAAYVAADSFDASGSAATALTNAKAYVDTALTWGEI